MFKPLQTLLTLETRVFRKSRTQNHNFGNSPITKLWQVLHTSISKEIKTQWNEKQDSKVPSSSSSENLVWHIKTDWKLKARRGETAKKVCLKTEKKKVFLLENCSRILSFKFIHTFWILAGFFPASSGRGCFKDILGPFSLKSIECTQKLLLILVNDAALNSKRMCMCCCV